MRQPDRLLSFLFLIALWPAQAFGLPQFPLRFGSEIYDAHGHLHGAQTMDCRACHINPTGGGMRNAHGRQFALEKLSIPRGDPKHRGHGGDEKQAKTESSPLSFGADFRFAYLHAQEQSTSAYKNSFFPMQGDLYVAFTPTPQMTLYYQDGFQGNKELFALTQGDTTHFKFGKFLPPYGLKLDDHTSFIREKLGFANNLGQDAEYGMEAGLGEDRWFGNAALFNGNGSAADDNSAKGVSATGGLKLPALWLAVSYYHNKKGTPAPETRDLAGAYTATRLWRLSLLGEWDEISVKKTGTEQKGDAAYAEVNTSLYPGVIAKIKYDRYDPNQTVAGDTLQRVAWGFYLYPFPTTEILVQYRKNKEALEIRNDQYLAMIHWYF